MRRRKTDPWTLRVAPCANVMLRASWSAFAAALLAIGIAAGPLTARAQQGGVSAPGQVADYDIPAQDLDVALNAYIKASGAQVFYETALTTGRRSARVKGQLTPDAALQVLLAGSGLAARRAGQDAFSIIATTTRAAGASVAGPAGSSRFVAELQAGVLRALCSHPQTRPGGYKIAFELWMGPAGRVQSSALLGSTGDAARDTALIAALQSVAVGAVPPADMPQPIVMAIAPRPPQETGDCVGQ